jgi:hypothetical protein
MPGAPDKMRSEHTPKQKASEMAGSQQTDLDRREPQGLA